MNRRNFILDLLAIGAFFSLPKTKNPTPISDVLNLVNRAKKPYGEMYNLVKLSPKAIEEYFKQLKQKSNE